MDEELKELHKAILDYQTAWGCQYDPEDHYAVTARPKSRSFQGDGRVLPCPRAE